MRKKVVSAILCASMVAGMVVIPGVAVKADDKKLIGVTMPTKDLQRWNQDGENMKKELEAAGYEVDLQYASNDVSTQVSQLENQVANGCDLLVVASIDGSSLGEPLKQAKEAGIPVISYDRLLMNSDAVTYYATFDNYKVGQKQGEYLVDALDLDNQDGPFNIELFTGDPGDNNCNFFFGGAMDVLQKYIDEGKLVVKSGLMVFNPEDYLGTWRSKNGRVKIKIKKLSQKSVTFTYSQTNKKKTATCKAKVKKSVAGNATRFSFTDSLGNVAKGYLTFDNGRLYVNIKTKTKAEGAKVHPSVDTVMIKE